MVACLPFSGELVSGLAAAPTEAVLGVLYPGAIPTALAFSTWAYALSRMPAGQLGISTYIVPPLAILMGFFVFAEVPAVLAIIGERCVWQASRCRAAGCGFPNRPKLWQNSQSSPSPSDPLIRRDRDPSELSCRVCPHAHG